MNLHVLLGGMVALAIFGSQPAQADNAANPARACLPQADDVAKLLESQEFGPGWLNDEVVIEEQGQERISYSLSFEPLQARHGRQNNFFNLVLDKQRCQLVSLTRPGANLDTTRQLQAGLAGPCDPKARNLVTKIHRITNPTADFIIDELLSETHNVENWLVEVSVEHSDVNTNYGYSVIASSASCELRQVKNWLFDDNTPDRAARLKLRGSILLRDVVTDHAALIEDLLNPAATAHIDLSTVQCLGVLAEDAGDVSFPEDGVFGTCLARADQGWPDSDDTIIQITVAAPGPEFEFSVKVLAEQM